MDFIGVAQTVGEFSILIRDRKGLTQIELANKLGLSQAAIGQIERNKTPKPLSYCKRLKPLLTKEEQKELREVLIRF